MCARGDYLDLAHPPPWKYGIAERNLAAVWSNYRDLGYCRLIYTNTASVTFTGPLVAAMGDDPAVTAVLLTATDATVLERLRFREVGSARDTHLQRSADAARSGWGARRAPLCTASRPTVGTYPNSPARLLASRAGESSRSLPYTGVSLSDPAGDRSQQEPRWMGTYGHSQVAPRIPGPCRTCLAGEVDSG